MTQHEYRLARGRLGQELRDVREDRRIIRDMFRGTTDPDLIRAWAAWTQSLVDADVKLSWMIVRLDQTWSSNGT